MRPVSRNVVAVGRCSRIFQEKVSGTRTRSHALDELLATARASDTVALNRPARLGRNPVPIMQLVKEFNRRGVHFRALNLASTPGRRPAS